jgi:membrane protein DedA with SNARE-associated domain
MELAAYISLFAAVVATWVAVSGPGEAALIGAGTIAGRDGEIVAVLLVAFAGTVAGSALAYWIGHAAGRRLLLWRGPFLRWRVRALYRSEQLIRRRQFLAALLAPGWMAGINDLSLRPFAAGTVVSGLAWTLCIGLGAALVGPSLIAVYDEVSQWVAIGALGAVTVAALVLLGRQRSSL